MYVEQIEVGTRVRDIAQMSDGRIALLSDHDGILLLQRAPIYCHDEYDIESIFSYDAADVCTDISGTVREAANPMIRSLNDAKFGSPIMRSLFNVYVHEDKLVYVKSPCSEDDISHRFFLHITPANTEDLAQENTQHGFNVYDFNSSEDYVGKLSTRAGASWPSHFLTMLSTISLQARSYARKAPAAKSRGGARFGMAVIHSAIPILRPRRKPLNRPTRSWMKTTNIQVQHSLSHAAPVATTWLRSITWGPI